MSKPITITIPHDLGAAVARQRIEEGFGKISQQFGEAAAKALTKTWTGDLIGTSAGTMLSAGDQSAGTAGYVALEVFTGRVNNLEGSFALQQFGTMDADGMVLHYEIVPGSGTEQLAGIRGTVDLDVVEGVHKVVLHHNL